MLTIGAVLVSQDDTTRPLHEFNGNGTCRHKITQPSPLSLSSPPFVNESSKGGALGLGFDFVLGI